MLLQARSLAYESDEPEGSMAKRPRSAQLAARKRPRLAPATARPATQPGLLASKLVAESGQAAARGAGGGAAGQPLPTSAAGDSAPIRAPLALQQSLPAAKRSLQSVPQGSAAGAGQPAGGQPAVKHRRIGSAARAADAQHVPSPSSASQHRPGNGSLARPPASVPAQQQARVQGLPSLCSSPPVWVQASGPHASAQLSSGRAVPSAGGVLSVLQRSNAAHSAQVSGTEPQGPSSLQQHAHRPPASSAVGRQHPANPVSGVRPATLPASAPNSSAARPEAASRGPLGVQEAGAQSSVPDSQASRAHSGKQPAVGFLHRAKCNVLGLSLGS